MAARDAAASASSITTVESPATTTGSLMVVGVRCNSVSVTVTSVTDTALNTYTKAAGPITSSVTSLELWRAYNLTANAANFVTANFSSSVGSRDIFALEFSGIVSTEDPFDVTANAAAAASLSATTGTFTTTTPTQLIVAISQHESGSGTWWAYDPDHLGVIGVAVVGNPVVAAAFKVVTAIQTGATVTMGSTSNVPRQLIVATFKVASVSGGGGSYAFA